MMHAYPLAKRPTRAGFTLIEMIGVMVVISILFAAAVPSVVNLIRTQRSVDDRAALPKIAAALKLGMLREQRFPLDMNASTAGTAADADYWWNLATRHGAGSANEARYPLGTIPGEANTRKLYFAKASWGGQSFFEITGDGSTWLADPLNPQELRLLLVSTTNPDLPLADVLTNTQFNAFWNNWAIGSDGNPASGDWPNYGLSKDPWTGRAPELNIERIDLREWLCTVSVEVRRRVDLSNLGINPFDANNVENTSDLRRVVLENTSGASVYIARSADTTGSTPTYTIGSIVIDGAPIAEIESVDSDEKVYFELPPQLVLRANSGVVQRRDLELDQRNQTLSGFDNNSSAIQQRYFLRNENIVLQNDVGAEVGIFTITDNFSTLRFDGLQWHY
ncbi:MAG: prepilin-type N-terminal cleavage/methylation domain-containing protein [Opitutales bacterium]